MRRCSRPSSRPSAHAAPPRSSASRTPRRRPPNATESKRSAGSGSPASDAELLPAGTPRAAAALARSATMLVTSRFHPAVFAGPTGVPTAALAADDYTAVKLRGATGWWEQRGVLDLAEAASPDGGAALARAWDRRREDRAAAARLRGRAELAASAWFDRIARVLGGDTG